jgi:hypothetical protein
VAKSSAAFTGTENAIAIKGHLGVSFTVADASERPASPDIQLHLDIIHINAHARTCMPVLSCKGKETSCLYPFGFYS